MIYSMFFLNVTNKLLHKNALHKYSRAGILNSLSLCEISCIDSQLVKLMMLYIKLECCTIIIYSNMHYLEKKFSAQKQYSKLDFGYLVGSLSNIYEDSYLMRK